MNPGAIQDSKSIFAQKGKAEEDAYIRSVLQIVKVVSNIEFHHCLIRMKFLVNKLKTSKTILNIPEVNVILGLILNNSFRQMEAEKAKEAKNGKK